MKFLQKKLLHLVIFLLFCFAALYITFPLIFHLGDRVTGWGDELLLAWIYNWVIHAFITNPLTIFNGNIYYPYQNTLAYSDVFITSSLLSAIPLFIIKEPIAATNFTFISAFALLGFSIYLLTYYLVKDYCAAFFSGIVVIFSPEIFNYYTHLQMLTIEWVPLAILFFIIFLKSKQTKYFLFFLGCFVLQMYNSFLPGYFIVFSCIIIFCFWYFNNKKKSLLLISKKNVFFLLLTGVLILPVIVPYYQVSKQFNYERDIRDAIHLSLQPEDLLYTSSFSKVNPYLNNLPINKKSQNNEFQAGFPGIIFSFLIIVILYIWITTKKKNDIYINSFLTIGFTGIVLSLGPVLHLGRQTIHHPFPIPLPYALFYYVIPGFNGLRNAARWEMLFILSMGILSGLVLSKVLKRYSQILRFIIYFLLVIGVMSEYNFPMQFYPIPKKENFPKVYSWLATTAQDSKIIEFPIYSWNMWPYTGQELFREYYSTVDFRSTVNGYSGFSPPPWQKLVAELTGEFPSNKTIKLLKEMKINYIIIHADEYTLLHKNHFAINNQIPPDGNTIITISKQFHSLEFVKAFGRDYIFAIR